MPQHAYIAFDLGAESGRAMLATLDGQRLELKEVHRFANLPQRLPSGYHWNLVELWRQLVEGLRLSGEAARQGDIELHSLGVDTWGLDFGIIGKSGQLLGLPYAYRDARTGPAFDKAIAQLGRQAIYDVTGIQFMAINSLYQLIAQHDAEPAVLQHAAHLLFMPDLLHYFFTGRAVNEATIASTAQMIDARTGKWAVKMLEALGLPTHFLGEILPAGSVIGALRDEVAQQANVPPIAVIAPGAHDTASAVAAVPVDSERSANWAYLSSGTWSLMGAELDEPIVSDAARQANFTNEGGVAGKVRFLRNLAGLWLVQECRRDYAQRGQAFDYAQLTELAAAAQPFRTLIDPGHGPFGAPGDLCAKITAFAKDTGQPQPQAPGQFVRCCLESLALIYRQTLDGLEQILGRRMDVLHIVGGGGRNVLLNQMTADAIDRPVIVGPYEATAIGNALTQAMGAGHVRDLAHLRQIVRASCDLQTYQPRNAAAFTEQAQRFTDLLGE